MNGISVKPKSPRKPIIRSREAERLRQLYVIIALSVFLFCVYSVGFYTVEYRPEHFDKGRISAESYRSFLMITSPIMIWWVYAMFRNFISGS